MGTWNAEEWWFVQRLTIGIRSSVWQVYFHLKSMVIVTLRYLIVSTYIKEQPQNKQILDKQNNQSSLFQSRWLNYKLQQNTRTMERLNKT